MNGIYILANDFVYHQLVALLNSIEVNISPEIPICIIPYDDRLDRVKDEIAQRSQVTLFENHESIDRWEAFALEAWKSHDRAHHKWRDLPSQVYRLAMHRKLCCFDGPFEKFVYFDADTLAMGSINLVFQKLDRFDWVANDYQYCSDLKYIFDAPEEDLWQVFDPERLKSNIFCAGWFASRKGVFTRKCLELLLERLSIGEANVLALRGPDQSLLNYMVLQSWISYYNFAYHGDAPGSHWSSTFEEIDRILYDKSRRLMYLHYMSIATEKFNLLCDGFDVQIPYQELFLHYRYLKTPIERPTSFKAVKKPIELPTAMTKAVRKISGLKNKIQQLTSSS